MKERKEDNPGLTFVFTSGIFVVGIHTCELDILIRCVAVKRCRPHVPIDTAAPRCPCRLVPAGAGARAPWWLELLERKVPFKIDHLRPPPRLDMACLADAITSDTSLRCESALMKLSIFLLPGTPPPFLRPFKRLWLGLGFYIGF